jgi:rhodanese-related sulfurtransferase
MRRSQIGEALLLDSREADDTEEQRAPSETPELDDESPSQSLLEGGHPKAPKPVNAGVVLVCSSPRLIGIHNLM